MFNSTTLDVAVGLALVFLLLSLIASATNELLEIVLKRRAAELERGIKEFVGTGGYTKFVDDLYGHGLINSLFRGKYDPNNKKNLPSYIPSKNFALALIDVAKSAANNLPPNIQTGLNTLRATAGQDAAKFQSSIEQWYDSSMDRVAGWYKRQTQVTIFAIGLLISIAINADCVVIAKRLSTDSGLREAAVKVAEQQSAIASKTSSPIDSIKTNLWALDGVGLPLGWQNDQQKSVWGVFAHIPGWILTAIAISLGAPFWFDLLNKIMVVRATVKPHEKSEEEASKEATSANIQSQAGTGQRR